MNNDVERFSRLTYRDVIEHKTLKNADKTPLRARVNGRIKTWKTRPGDFLLPMKHGLKSCFYIDHNNCGEWNVPSRCERCGGDKPKGQSCGCFDNGSQ